MDTQDEIYRRLQRHLDTSPVGYPETESGVEIRLLKDLITPEEAEMAVHCSTMAPEPAARIYERIREAGISMSLDDLKKMLDHMAYRGILLVFQEGYKEKHYKNAGVTAGGMTDFQVNRLTKGLAKDFYQYHEEIFSQVETTGAIGVPQLRTIPVEKSIPAPEKHLVSTYDDVKKLVEDAPGPISVAPCVCRQFKDLLGRPCKHSDLREWCLQIGPDHARQYVEMGCGRYVTKEEAFEILDKAQEVGLILQPENSQHPENVCMCCGDCCDLLSAVKMAPRPVDFYASNFHAQIDPALCKGCGTCVKRCELQARTVVENIAVVDLDRCIGCGACVTGCETGAARLKKKEVETVPFKYKDDMFRAIMDRRPGR